MTAFDGSKEDHGLYSKHLPAIAIAHRDGICMAGIHRPVSKRQVDPHSFLLPPSSFRHLRINGCKDSVFDFICETDRNLSGLVYGAAFWGCLSEYHQHGYGMKQRADQKTGTVVKIT